MAERAAFVVDLNTCTGCRACEVACSIANEQPAGRGWREVRTYNELHVSGVELFHLSLACNHCLEAPCETQCPAGAYRRDDETDLLLIDEDACLGCRYCAWVCPYDAPRFDVERGVMTKCTGCIDRRREGREPACTEACPTGALSWRTLPENALVHDAPGFTDAGTAPALRIEPLRPERRTPETTEPPIPPPWRRLYDRIVPAVTVAHEWPLIVFTWTAALLVGVFSASRFGAPAPGWGWFAWPGAAAIALGASHLGRRRRATRAALGLRTSWLSREVVGFGLFIAGAVVSSAFTETPARIGWATVVTGAATLFVVDRVYGPGRVRGSPGAHSSDVLLAGLLFACAWGGAERWTLYAAAAKIAAYALRKRRRSALGLPARGLATALRVGLTAAGAAGTTVSPAAGLALLATAELIDRTEYYDELEIPTPASGMLDHLGERV